MRAYPGASPHAHAAVGAAGASHRHLSHPHRQVASTTAPFGASGTAPSGTAPSGACGASGAPRASGEGSAAVPR